jgi:hypothetical protein
MVEIIPKAREQYSLFNRVFFGVSAVSLVVALGGFLLFLFLESKSQGELGRLEALLATEKTPEEVQLEKDVSASRIRLQDFSGLVRERKNLLLGFLFLQETAHPEVLYVGANLDSSLNNMQVKGNAASFIALEEQIAIFQAREELSSLSLTSLRLAQERGVDFQLELQFPKAFFQ